MKSNQDYRFTDKYNAERFASMFGGMARWCEKWNSWMVFNGKYWERDTMKRVEKMAKLAIKDMYGDAKEEPNDELSKAIAKHATASLSHWGTVAMLADAKSELPVDPSQFNNQPYLLNCPNGTVDLKTGELRQHDEKDMLTRCTKVNYTPSADCPKWKEFVQMIFHGDQELIRYVRMALGMSLTGDVSAECMFVCHGTGDNGKTTLLQTVKIILGDYAKTTNMSAFEENADVKRSIANLFGARFVYASENKPGSKLNEGLIRNLASNEEQEGERKYEHAFTFMPEYTVWLLVNHKPIVKDQTRGLWRRLKYIPFTFQLDPKDINDHFREEVLSEEYEGIFAWLVRGCVELCKQKKLIEPKIVTSATKNYRMEMDTFGRFIDDECVLGDRDEFGQEIKIKTKDLMDAYQEWCDANAVTADYAGLKKELNNRGLHSDRKGFYGKYGYHGIRIKNHKIDSSDTSGPQENFVDKLEQRCSEVMEGMEGMEGKILNYDNITRIRGGLVNSTSTPSTRSITQNGNQPEIGIDRPEMSDYEKAERENLIRLLEGRE